MERVLLREALHVLDPFENGMALALSTEGYSADKDALLAYSLAPLSGGDGAMIYVAGGDPTKGGNVNNINPETYRLLAVPARDAWQVLAQLCNGASFVVAHDTGWALRFLDKLRIRAEPDAEPLEGARFINSLALARCRGFGMLHSLAQCDSVKDLCATIDGLPAPKRADGGCSLKKLAEAFEVPVEQELPLCERNAQTLRGVFMKLLDQPC